MPTDSIWRDLGEKTDDRTCENRSNHGNDVRRMIYIYICARAPLGEAKRGIYLPGKKLSPRERSTHIRYVPEPFDERKKEEKIGHIGNVLK